METLLALPLDAAMKAAESAGLTVCVRAYGPPRAVDLIIEDPAQWRVARQRSAGYGAIELVAVPSGLEALRLPAPKG